MKSLSSDHQHGDGYFSDLATSGLQLLSHGSDVLLTPSCTHSLEMASMLGKIGPGDEVILPSFNFSSGAIAIERFGGIPVFVDIDPVTKCIDIAGARAAVTKRTKAISWVNYAGLSPNMEEMATLANDFNLFLIEDNAHGLGGTFRDQFLGTFGDVSTLSFHATKNIQCGEGGALVVNDENLLDLAKVIREKGTNRAKFLIGAVQKYEWVGPGSSYLMADSLAAVLLGQLEIFDQIQSNRVANWEKYYSFFSSQDSKIFKLPSNNFQDNKNIAHNFYIELQSQEERMRFTKILSKNQIEASFHYQPLHLSPAGRKYFPHGSRLEHTERVSRTILRLPLYFGLEEEIWDKLETSVAEFENPLRA
jgi:dTDP-4-amino-4,6-dideoxygalactose transaminase